MGMEQFATTDPGHHFTTDIPAEDHSLTSSVSHMINRNVALSLLMDSKVSVHAVQHCRH